MKKGFTLLELIVVIIIIGILATLGFSQYTRMVERSRGAEGRSVLGNIRTQAAALWIEFNVSGATIPVSTITPAAVGIGNALSLIPNACNAASSPNYYFSYTIAQVGQTGFLATATRCVGALGKQPGAVAAVTLTLATDFVAGTDVWAGNGGY